jgi:hypothetical protein
MLQSFKNPSFQDYALSLELQISKEEQEEQQRLWDQAKVRRDKDELSWE